MAAIRETVGFPGPGSPWSYIDRNGHFVFKGGE
jgi:hypothetical protein